MRALTFDGTLQLRRDIPIPEPRADEALVRVLQAGICNTDLELTLGYKGFHGILGHEFVGTVAECRDRSWLGQRVCADINISCGACNACGQGMTHHCARRQVVGIVDRPGVFAEFVALPTCNLRAVPAAVPTEAAVFAEPLAAALEILEQVSFLGSTRVIVLGDGKLGLLCAQAIASTGADVVVAGRHEAKLELARTLGLRAMPVADVADTLADVVVEATGSAGGLEAAMNLVRPRGAIVLKSTIAEQVTIDLSPLVVNEITVVGSRCGPMAVALDYLERGIVQVLPLVSERYALEDGVVAMQRAAAKETIKIVIDVSAESELYRGSTREP